jgi:hypothetical protein
LTLIDLSEFFASLRNSCQKALSYQRYEPAFFIETTG